MEFSTGKPFEFGVFFVSNHILTQILSICFLNDCSLFVPHVRSHRYTWFLGSMQRCSLIKSAELSSVDLKIFW